VLPSRQEGLPLVVVEAMLCGRPCLVTNVSGNPEHVLDGETGFLAGGPTVDEVDKALERAWHQRSQFPAMGLAAYHHIRTRVPQDPIGIFAERLRALAAPRRVPSPTPAATAASS
jgi:glycosyltransferase involved in cell wall biosynthesis